MIFEWIGESRMVPNVGRPVIGDKIEIDESLGDSLAAQGLCKRIVSDAPAVPAKTVKEI